jgi:DNA-binding CsgD family transcriptional regulator
LGRALHAAGPAPADRKRALLEGACRLTGTERGLCVVTHLDEPTGHRRAVSVVTMIPRDAAAQGPDPTDGGGGGGDDNDNRHATGPAAGSDAGGGTTTPSPRSGADAWRRSANAEALRRRAGVGVAAIESLLPLDGARVLAWLAVGRRPGDRRPFTPRHRAILDLLHAESAWVYGPDLLLASADVRALSPRQRQTLQHLLAGDAEKQIAAKLRLSPNTVHHYVKALYRRFGVSSRAELLAQWVHRA